ncbi:MAG TPA: DUF2971 domain-containing protein [Sedimentisphaerales bacterium]|nr:DUF2971 domain-containing protein [Sedimentisphaerales bacterium]
MKRQDKDYLYHYTTLEAFINIVKEQEIWASNIFYMNDTREFHWAVDLAKKLLKTEMDSRSVENRDTLARMDDELTKIKPGDVPMSVFGCSFSEKNDDLNQWRAYCHKGGVSIGFRRTDLDDIAETQSGTGFVRCVYDENEQRSLIREAISRAVEANPGGGIASKILPEERAQWCALFLQFLLAEMPIKDPTFEGEREWRWIRSPEPGIRREPEPKEKDAEIVTDPVGFRTRDGLIIPYWKFKLNPYSDMKIWRNCQITVGPNPHMHETKASIEHMLKYYCDETWFNSPSKVELSKVPDRYC